MTERADPESTAEEPAPEAATPVLDPTREIGPAPTFAGPRPDADVPTVTPHTGATAPGGVANDRPEVVVGGALAGGLVLGLILKHLGN